MLRLEMGRISFLLPGDIGSDTSSTEVFLDAVNPQVVVISVGADNKFGHPSPEVLARYAERGVTVLRTDERGTIELSTDGERLWVETGR